MYPIFSNLRSWILRTPNVNSLLSFTYGFLSCPGTTLTGLIRFPLSTLLVGTIYGAGCATVTKLIDYLLPTDYKEYHSYVLLYGIASNLVPFIFTPCNHETDLFTSFTEDVFKVSAISGNETTAALSVVSDVAESTTECVVMAVADNGVVMAAVDDTVAMVATVAVDDSVAMTAVATAADTVTSS